MLPPTTAAFSCKRLGFLRRIRAPMRAHRPRRSRNSKRRAAPANALLMRLQISSDPSLLSVVRGALERLTETLGFSAPDCRSVTRAVDEALTNIMRHCYGGRLDGPIDIFCSRLRPRS